MLGKVLVANRGEIAVRVLRACRELSIPSVAVYSDADRHSLHTRLADEAVHIGPAAALQSYLSIDNILQAARLTHATAVHPGYGFLSENACFAQAVVDAGLIFIGPSPEAMRAMGDKAQARQRMEEAGVPVAPGCQGLDDLDALRTSAARLGYPVLVKAASGGGGKGMRVISTEAEFLDAAQAARREALHAFGDQRLILEKFIQPAHHVEIQVLGDQYGSVIHLFERECSVQRRHQKIIEETPSPHLDPALRERMGAAAVAVARAVGYHNAGTVEFILDPLSGQFFFLEMNTRLQVEHPITELVTGVDLVHWQLRLAAGEPLALRQEQLTQRGHAIECRLYAEDPANGFLPTAGHLLRFIEPAGPGVRVDSGITSGDEIPVHYDPLVAKISVLAGDRPSAVRRMQAALQQTVLLGLANNARFLAEVLTHPDFLAGKVHTTWIEQNFASWQPPECDPPPEVLVAAALAQFSFPAPASGIQTVPGIDPYSPWRSSPGFRPGAAAERK